MHNPTKLTKWTSLKDLFLLVLVFVLVLLEAESADEVAGVDDERAGGSRATRDGAGAGSRDDDDSEEEDAVVTAMMIDSIRCDSIRCDESLDFDL